MIANCKKFLQAVQRGTRHFCSQDCCICTACKTLGHLRCTAQLAALLCCCSWMQACRVFEAFSARNAL